MDNRQGDQSSSNLHEELKKLQNTASGLKDALSSVNASLMDFSKNLDSRLQQSAKSVDDEMRQLRDAVQSLRIDCNDFQRTGTQIADAIKWSMLERAKQSLALTNSFERMTDRLGVIESMFRFLPGQGMPMLAPGPNAFAFNQPGFPAAMVPVSDLRNNQFMGHPGTRPPLPTAQRFGNMHGPVYSGHGVPVILPPAVRSESPGGPSPGQLEMQDRKFVGRQCQDTIPPLRQPDYGQMLPPNYMSHAMPSMIPPVQPQKVVNQKIDTPSNLVASRGIDSEVLVSYLSLMEDRLASGLRARLTVFPGEKRVVLSAEGEDPLIDCPLNTLVVTADQEKKQIGIHDGSRVFKIIVASCAMPEELFGVFKSLHESFWRIPSTQGTVVASQRKDEGVCSRCKAIVGRDSSLCNDCLSREDYSTPTSELSDHSDNDESYSSDGFDDAREATRRGISAMKNKKHEPLSLNASNPTSVEPLFGNFKWKPGATPGGLFANAGSGASTLGTPGHNFLFPTRPSAFAEKPMEHSVKSTAPGIKLSREEPERSPMQEKRSISGVMREGLTEKFSAIVTYFRQSEKPDSQLKDSPAGCLKIFEDELGRRRILFELNQGGKPGCNHFITTQTKLSPNKEEENSCSWSALDFNDDEKGKTKHFFVQFKNRDDYDRFCAVFNRTDRGAVSNKSTPEYKTGKIPDRSPGSGLSTPSFLFSVDKSSTASDQKKPLFGSFSFEKPPITSMGQQGGDKTPLFGQPLKSDKLLFSGKFPGAGCSLTEIVDRTGKAGNLFGSSNDSKKAVFGTAVKPLFSQTPAGDVKPSADKSDGDVAGEKEQVDDSEPQFEPAITMPASVTLVTGEEGLTEKFCAKAILYRFQKDDSGGQWKERGRGLMKILEEPSGRRRVLLRRDHVHKLACNHIITAKMQLRPHNQKENCFCWFAMDFSDNEKGIAERFSVRFTRSDDAKAFAKEFDAGREFAESLPKTDETKNLHDQTKSDSHTSGLKLLCGREGDWSCPQCLASNPSNCSSCKACSHPREDVPASSKSAGTATESKQAAPSFLLSQEMPSTASDQKKPLFGSFSFEKSPITSMGQQGGDKTPLFGQPLKSEKLLFSGKFPGAGCSLTEIVDRTGKAGNLFGSSNDSKKAVFGTAVKPLFSQALGGNAKPSGHKGDGDVVGEKEQVDDSEPQFEPAITMPASVTLVTGEEGLTEKFCAKAVLFRFQKDDSGGQWKERGRGSMKILEEPSGRRRVLLRRDHVHKLACNHVIAPKMQLRPHTQKENCFCWFAMDFSDSEKGAVEQFCARFKLAAEAEAFRKEFEIGAKRDDSGSTRCDFESQSGSGGNLPTTCSDLKSLDNCLDEWGCQKCLVRNKPDDANCAACGEARVHEQA